MKKQSKTKTPDDILSTTLDSFSGSDRFVVSKISGKDSVFYRHDIVVKAIKNAVIIAKTEQKTEQKAQSDKDEVAFLTDFKNAIADSQDAYIKNQNILGVAGYKQVIEFLYNTIKNVTTDRVQMLAENKTYQGLKKQLEQEEIKKQSIRFIKTINIMKLSQIERVSDLTVEKWLVQNLDLDETQQRNLRNFETIRFSPYIFYRYRKEKRVSLLWRFTLILFPIFFLIIFIFNPIKWMVTGKWGYGQKFMDKYYYGWLAKLNL